MIAILILSALIPVQEPGPEKIAELVRRLSDDDVEVRERARGELIRLGPAALESMRKHLVSTDPAVREELKAVIARIEREIILGEYKGSPSLITLKAERLPLKQVLEAIGKQSRTPVVADGIPGDERVTFDLNRVPFFEAMDRICRAHGGIRMRLEETYPPGEEIPLHRMRLERGQTAGRFRHVDGQFAVELESLVGVQTSDFSGTWDSWFNLTFRVAWERGTRPIRAGLTLTSAIDEKGDVYHAKDMGGGKGGRRMFIPSKFYLPLDRLPPEDVRTFREIAGVFELEFPREIEILRIPEPAGKIGTEMKGAQFWFKLIEFTKTERGYACVLEYPSPGHMAYSWDRDMRLVDREGKTYLGEYYRMISGNRGLSKGEVRFEVPPGAVIAELRHTDLVGGEVRRIEWKFKDVPLR